MKNTHLFPLERNRYFYGKLLSVRDFEAEQTYMNNKRRLINRAVLGAGVVCGLGVTRTDDFTLLVDSGLALDGLGREIVLQEPVIRKLQMLEGYGQLEGRRQAYLCLSYDERPIEPVNAVGAENQDTQYNLVEENYRLWLDAQQPNLPALLAAAGWEQVCTLVASEQLTLAFSVPHTALAGEKFLVRCLVVKGRDEPLSFRLTLDSEFITDNEGSRHIVLHYTQSAQERRKVYPVEFTLRAAAMQRAVVELCQGEGLLETTLGDAREAVPLTLSAQIELCADKEEELALRRRRDNLPSRLDGEELPLYLARLDLLYAGSAVMVSALQSLPFGQRLRQERREGAAGGQALRVTSGVQMLKYWQKPEAQAAYNPDTGELHLSFGLPVTQEYDYATASGVVEIPMSSGMRVNARYYSDEVPHNLGTGYVDLRLAVEFNDGEEPAQLVGPSEVFKGRGGKRDVPFIQLAAILYPRRGTFRVGAWLMDNVAGSAIRVRYYASKVARDTAALRMSDQVSLRITPEVHRVKPLGRLHFKAAVSGSAEKGVAWSVRDENGGSIDSNGLYQAPDVPGTYEIAAVSKADGQACASAFIIVED